jgi:cell division protein FtsZ
VQGISDIITIPGIINRDFADVKTTMAGMGHAVMGTAVRSGENRAVEAAQAAMASPLLEAGAIDGARGILINITGSSTLRLSEVNEASSLIQTAAHEDANIIFGAVLDEKMGDEVKITVIATGFRDQMPERRARMLSVEQAPVVSVPVVASENWMKEPAPAPAQESGPPRFQSQDEDEGDETAEDDTAFFFSASNPTVSTTVNVAPSPAKTEVNPAVEPEPERRDAAAEPTSRFAEMDEEPLSSPLLTDYTREFNPIAHGTAAAEGHRTQSSTALFTEPDEESLRELDTPTFMRRLRF